MARKRSGYKITVYLDDNPNSSGYMETYDEREYDSGVCPIREDDLVLVSSECEIDISGHTGYRILIYFNRTTSEYTQVRELDADCGQASSDEIWVNSGSPFCETTEEGVNTHYMLQLQVQTNIDLPNYGATRYNRYYSQECERNDCPTWEEIQRSCHIAVINCSLTFDGSSDVVQIDTNPISPLFNTTRTINVEDSACTNCTDTQFVWVDEGVVCGSDDIICSNGIKEDGLDPFAQYRWVDIDPSIDWICSGTSKHYKQKLEVSYDSGQTWTDVEPEQTRRGDLIEAQSTDCGYVPPTPPSGYSSQYLTFVARENGTFKLSGNSVNYSLDSGSTWTTLASNTNSPTVTSGSKIMWKATLTPNVGIGTFSSTAKFDVEGNAMSLLYGDNFRNQTSLSGKDDAFYSLFSGNTNVVSAENMSLPATTLSRECYSWMFYECSSLTSAPSVLPATTLASSCYACMFLDCSSLTTTPELPATTLAYHCYGWMFSNCTSLTTAPELPATTLANSCYHIMFGGCTSLTTAPKLPITTLADNCYEEMFFGCTSLTTAPQLPASILTERCYNEMFRGCTSLTTAPVLSSTTLANGCYGGMFGECSGLTTAPQLPATTLSDWCYAEMFANCTSLRTAPVLSSTTLAQGCYAGMFVGCTSLTEAPELPATTLANYCYEAMFWVCSGLATVPQLPATTLAEGCYYQMFFNCTNLNYIKCLATDISASDCTSDWVTGVASSGTFVKDASMSSWTRDNNGIPTNWTVQNAS